MSIDFSNKEDFSKFGKTFQEGLCQLILQDRTFSDQISEVLEPSLFELQYLQVFCDKVFSYKDKYGIHPSHDVIMTILRTELEDENEATQKQIRDYFARVLSKNYKVEGSEYIKETSLEFCKKQKLKEAIIKSIKLLGTSSFEQIKTLIDNALKLGSDNNFGYDYLKDFEERFVKKHRNTVTTGWESLDEMTEGGLGKSELGVVVAPTGAGKSMVLVHFGAQALLQGKTVVHYTLELQDTVVARRYDSCITGVDINDLFENKEKVLETVKNIEGKLIVKEYPTKTASTNTLKAHLDKLVMRGEEIGMIIVDYGDLLRPARMRDEKRIELESIYEELRSLAQTFECPVWTASQTNRTGLNAEIVTMESISEAFNKCFVADLIVSLSRTVQDKNSNSGRLFVAKNRNGYDGIVLPVFMNTSNVKIKVLEYDPDLAIGETSKSRKDMVDDLREKYKEFRKKKEN